MPFKNRHYKNLPRTGTTVTLLDRKGTKAHDALVVERIGRNGKLRVAYVLQKRGQSTRIHYTTVVPNDSAAAADKTIRFRWAYGVATLPKFAEGDAPKKVGAGSVRTLRAVPAPTGGTVTGRTNNNTGVQQGALSRNTPQGTPPPSVN
jgi:hypothetical protein